MPSADVLAGAAGAALSLIFAYVPKLNAWYAALSGTRKRVVMIAVLLAATIGLAVNACAPFTDIAALGACLAASWQEWLKLFGTALVLNQGTYLIAPRK